MTTNSGFWEAGLEGNTDRLNACLIQLGLLSARPSPGQQGRIYILTDSGLEGRSYVDDGSAWQERISVNPVAATAGLRTLGTGATQAAAGDHVHTPAEDGTNTGLGTGSSTVSMDQGRTMSAGATNTTSITVTLAKAGRLTGGVFNIDNNAGNNSIDLNIDGVQVATVQNTADKKILAGSRSVAAAGITVAGDYNDDASQAPDTLGPEVWGVGTSI